MKDNKICEHNWVDKSSYKQCSLCNEIESFDFKRINGITLDLDTDNDHFYQLEDEVEQSDVHHQNDKRD